MAFSEKLKLQVKEWAMFQCCRCKAIGVDVHHILPQKDGGSDDIDNAASLCQNCHDQFGDNPQKRKEIRQMRDHWYETVKGMYSGQSGMLFSQLEKINNTLGSVVENQARGEEQLFQLKDALKEASGIAIDRMTAGTASLVASNFAKASLASGSNVKVEDLYEVVMCLECGEPAPYRKDEDNPVCRNCGMPLWH